MQRIDLSQHISRQKLNAIRKICGPLFNATSVEKFSYVRRYAHDGVTCLVTHEDWTSYFFEDGAYPDSWLMGVPFSHFQSGFNFWQIANAYNNAKMDVISDTLRLINYHHGIEIIHKTDAYCDFYGFASRHSDLYRCSMSYLNRFAFYFKQKAQSLIQGAHLECFYPDIYDPYIDSLPILTVDTLSQEADQDFCVNRYYLTGELEEVYFTRKEMECLRLLKQGQSCKMVANALGGSARTVERHVDNMKKKVSASGLVELLQIAASHHLFKC